MAHMHRARWASARWLCFMLCLVCLDMFSPAKAHAAPVDAGVSRELATVRAARLSDLHYALSFDVQPQASTIPGEETLTFKDSGTGDLALDYRDGTLSSAQLNGQPIPVALVNGHLTLPGERLVHGRNELKLAFASNVAAAGKAFTRYTDRDDGNEYVYTLFVPMDASMAFPCFDQPDLKAKFKLGVSAPLDWQVVSNTHGVPQTNAQTAFTSFEETLPISTYLFAFTAGPWQSARRPRTGPARPLRPQVTARPCPAPKPRKSSRWPPAASPISAATSPSRSPFPSTTSS